MAKCQMHKEHPVKNHDQVILSSNREKGNAEKKLGAVYTHATYLDHSSERFYNRIIRKL